MKEPKKEKPPKAATVREPKGKTGKPGFFGKLFGGGAQEEDMDVAVRCVRKITHSEMYCC